MKKIFILLIVTCAFLTTGCFKFDNMEDINIITTTYPIEYVANYLYGDKSTITSIYPKSANVDTYTFTDKQIKDFSKNDLFIYNGASKEKEYAKTMIDNNRDLKIIDASYGIDNTVISDAYLNPANMLMIAQNIKNELENYITSNYIISDIEKNYDLLKYDMTELETEFKTTADNSSDKQIIVYDNSLNFLSKYGFTVINLTSDNENVEKNITLARSLLTSNKLDYIFVMENTEDNDLIKSLINDSGAAKITFRTLETITEKDVNNKDNYITLMHNNIDLIKQETYN